MRQTRRSPSARLRDTFASLREPRFRSYWAGQTVSSVGNWMQTIAQDWLVLELTGSATAVGAVAAAQFAPMLLFGVYGGTLVDRFSTRRILMVTHTVMPLLAATQAVLVFTGLVQVWHVYVVALLFGITFVVDKPARQTFTNELVPHDLLFNAISLTSAAFHFARLFGPALSGLLIATAGTGWSYTGNALSYAPMLVWLLRLRPGSLLPAPRVPRSRGQVREALRYAFRDPVLRWPIVLAGAVGAFGLNFPVVLAVFAHDVYDGGPQLYGLLTLAVAAGSLLGALASAGSRGANLRTLVLLTLLFGCVQAISAWSPTALWLAGLLVVVGYVSLGFQTASNASVQLTSTPVMRGRVMGLYSLAFLGGKPVGALLIGWTTEHLGPRAGMVLCGVVPLGVAVVVLLLVRPGRRSIRPVTPAQNPAQNPAR